MHISRVRIENLKGFRELDLKLSRADGGLAGWTVLAGRNGSGKTTLLRALALGIAGPRLSGRLCDMSGWMRVGADEMSVEITATPDGLNDYRHSHIPVRAGAYVVPATASVSASMSWRFPMGSGPGNPPGEPVLVEGPQKLIDEPLRTVWGPYSGSTTWAAYGYGSGRRLLRGEVVAEEKDVYGRVPALASLFQEDAALNNAVARLRGIYLRSLDPQLEGWEREQARELLQFLCDLLNHDLLPDGMNVERVDSRGLWVTQGAVKLLLEDLSDGYRLVAALVVDLVLRLSQDGRAFPHAHMVGLEPLPTQRSGVVLIDEADLHLHVSWQQRLGFWLKEHFPNIQFIVTTHSPFICQAADLIIRLPPPGSDEKAAPVSDEVFRAVVNGGADDAVMSELFGLDSSRSRAAEERLSELAQLERKVRKGQATSEERKRYAALDAQMPASVDVDRAVRPLAGEP